jgi:8-oxo-dGTP pyrophosphatase MutT (NUDIX family)
VPDRKNPQEPVDRAAAVCYRYEEESLQFKLVRTKAGRWTFPKGHIEPGEAPWQAAQREALEEAGVRGRIETELVAIFPHEKRARDGRSVELTVAVYVLHVESESDTPERGRDPTWFSPEEAELKLAEKRNPRYQQAYAHVIDEVCRRLAPQDPAVSP